jgi:hypothetical protein
MKTYTHFVGIDIAKNKATNKATCSQVHSMKPIEIPVFRGSGDIIFRAIKIPTKSSVLPLSSNDPRSYTFFFLFCLKKTTKKLCTFRTIILMDFMTSCS